MSKDQGVSGWQPLSKPNPEAGRPGASLRRRLNLDGSPIIGPFVRLAHTHALHAAGDATYAVALVGSIFALDTDAARGRILLYLLLTLAPFALVGPFIGPALDRMRGGRRLMIILTLATRALLMLLLVRNIDTFWLFPIAFTQLVMGKTYSVAKAATVPTTVSSEEELVEKNARLAVLGTVAGAVGAAPALGLQAIWGSTPTVAYAVIIYVVGTIAATRLPRVVVDDPQVPDDEIDMRSAGVRLASTAMAVMRGIAGFVFWLMVFAYGNNDIDTEGIGKAAGLAVRHALGFSIQGDNSQPAWKLGFVLASIGAGIFLGNILAPRLRQRFVEETMIIGALGAILIAALAAVWAGGLSGAVLLALIVGVAPASAKLAFDSLVQRDAPGANHGAAFGRFETRFQIASVIGSVLAVAPTVVIPVRIGGFIVALGAATAAAIYIYGFRALREGTTPSFLQMFGTRRDDGDGTHHDEPPLAEAGAAPARGPAGTQPVGGGGPSGGTGHAAAEVVYSAAPTTQIQAVDTADGESEHTGAAHSSTSAGGRRAGQRPGSSAQVVDRTDPQSSPARWSDASDLGTEGRAVSRWSGPADPYEQGFADRPIEPPPWSEALFDADDPAIDSLRRHDSLGSPDLPGSLGSLGPQNWLVDEDATSPHGDPSLDPAVVRPPRSSVPPSASAPPSPPSPPRPSVPPSPPAAPGRSVPPRPSVPSSPPAPPRPSVPPSASAPPSPPAPPGPPGRFGRRGELPAQDSRPVGQGFDPAFDPFDPGLAEDLGNDPDPTPPMGTPAVKP